jgi:hypothetical protein
MNKSILNENVTIDKVKKEYSKNKRASKKKKWYEYLWIASSLYLILGLFNILFAWLGLLCFLIPLMISFFGGGKSYCNRFCGRGQLLTLLGDKLHLSRNKPMPRWMVSKRFRYGFLIFFLIMFFNMIWYTVLVFQGVGSLKEVLTILWTFKLPFRMHNYSFVTPWIVQFSFGFYSMMLTSTILGILTMAMYKPRSWCIYCPMGTMTQAICKIQK